MGKTVKEAVKVEHEVKTHVCMRVSWYVIRNSTVPPPFPTHNAFPGTQFSVNSYAVKPEASTNQSVATTPSLSGAPAYMHVHTPRTTMNGGRNQWEFV